MKFLAVLYSYYEINRCPELRIDNLEYFLNRGLILDGNTDYYFLINGRKLTVSIPEHENIKIIYRDNKNFDFGAYSELLLSDDFNINAYEYFFFINDSVRGPFMFNWSCNLTDWRYVFKNLFDSETKLVGPTINNYNGQAHVNSECFMVDRIGLDIGLNENIFSKTDYNILDDVCQQCEVKYSQMVLDKGYNIKCMMLAYKNIDFRKYRLDRSLNANRRKGGDPLFSGQYYGINLNPFEVIFFKANRHIDDKMLDNYTGWILK